ncbi:MAG: hypothetical protein AAF570_26645, partial [Bacteroidota bacterium]
MIRSLYRFAGPLSGLSLLFMILLAGCAEESTTEPSSEPEPVVEEPIIEYPQKLKTLSSYVNTFIGTGGHGHTFPGATMPFGMAQISPDTRLEGWDGCSGYHNTDSVVYGFSHTHLSGTGVSDYGDLLLMPMLGPATFESGYGKSPDEGYASRFSKRRERGWPGYYGVMLLDDNISVELAATERGGLHKYGFDRNGQAFVVMDLAHRDPVIESSFKVVGDSRVEGMRRSNAWATDQHFYFSLEFSQPIISTQMQGENKDEKSASGKKVKAIFEFD